MVQGPQPVMGVAAAWWVLLLVLLALVATRVWQRRSDVAVTAPHRSDCESGPSYPGYRFLERIGSGGMASVYRAERLRDGVTVAIKVPRSNYSADSRFLRRFHREAQLAQSFDHPNVVATFEHGSHGSQHALVMAYVPGEPLDQVLEAANVHRDWACEVIAHIARGLQHIHAHGIVHRDLKAANVMVTPVALKRLGESGRLPLGAVKLMDFGIAAAASAAVAPDGGVRVGTPIAMSPEQARGLSVDQRADIYALGLIAYRLLSGEPPFRGNPEAIVHQQIFHTPPSPRHLRASVSVPLDALVMRMLAKDPALRPNLAEVLAVLQSQDGYAFAAEGRDRWWVLVRDPEPGLWQLDASGARPPRMVLGAEELGEPQALAAVPEGGWVVLASERGLMHPGGFFARRLSVEGQTMVRFAPRGVGVGQVTQPLAIVVAPDSSVLLLDRGSRRVQRYRLDGSFMAAFGGRGVGRGRFEDPRALAVDAGGKVYVLDSASRQVQRFHPDGRYDTRWAFLADAQQPEMRRLNGLQVTRDGRLLIAEVDTHSVRIIDSGGAVSASVALPAGLQGEGLVDLASDGAGGWLAALRGCKQVAHFDARGVHVGSVTAPAPIVQMLLVPKQW